MKLYHYRSIESALKEIQDGTFHFASREELNDPIEGYVRVYWQGDKAAWQGLLRNYVCSVLHSIYLYIAYGEKADLQFHLLMHDVHQDDDKPIGDSYRFVGDEFLRDNEIDRIAEFYGNNRLRVEKKELELILYFIHPKACDLSLKRMRNMQCISEDVANEILELHSHADVKFPYELVETVLKDELSRKQMTSHAMEAMEDMLELKYIKYGLSTENFLIKNYEKGHEDTAYIEKKLERYWMLITVDLPKYYIEQLEHVLYPEAFVVCFSQKNDDSSMWGNYADHHKGICLVYETNNDGTIIVHGRRMEAKKIEYDGEIIERNFFETFGRLSNNQIITWLTGKNGLSDCMKAFSDVDSWKKTYWNVFETKYYKKLNAWKNEEEYRIIIDNTFGEYSDIQSRNLRYDIKALKGIIFGIKTSEFDKERIYNAINRVMPLYGQIKFYQAEYDDEKQDIVVREKQLWNLKRS